MPHCFLMERQRYQVHNDSLNHTGLRLAFFQIAALEGIARKQLYGFQAFALRCIVISQYPICLCPPIQGVDTTYEPPSTTASRSAYSPKCVMRSSPTPCFCRSGKIASVLKSMLRSTHYWKCHGLILRRNVSLSPHMRSFLFHQPTIDRCIEFCVEWWRKHRL